MGCFGRVRGAQVKTPVGGDTQSRSILLVTLEEVDYLLVGLGDGHLVSFPIQVYAHMHTRRRRLLGLGRSFAEFSGLLFPMTDAYGWRRALAGGLQEGVIGDTPHHPHPLHLR